MAGTPAFVKVLSYRCFRKGVRKGGRKGVRKGGRKAVRKGGRKKERDIYIQNIQNMNCGNYTYYKIKNVVLSLFFDFGIILQNRFWDRQLSLTHVPI